jgi:dynein intermediate chain 1
VGTEEGRIHKGSLEAPGTISATFGGGHGMSVYAVRWNPWHPRVFISCSADWTVRLWDDSHTSGPVMRFDMNSGVSDVAWAPYSSTTFAATTEDQKVAVWDLAVSRKEPLCIQKTIPGKKNKCTHLAFNAAAPVILVGDVQGGVTSAKLSPNLRKITPIPIPPQRKGEAPVPPPSRAEVEIRKLDAILAMSDARIAIETPIPGSAAAKAGAEAAAEPEAAAE